MSVPAVGDRVDVTVEVPRGGRVKRRSDGGIDYVSPVGSPFNYGCVAHVLGGDGDPLDAIVLGPRLPAGTVVDGAEILAIVAFDDLDRPDDKLICGPPPLSDADRARVIAFFTRYAVLKRWLARARGRSGRIAYGGLVPHTRHDAP